MFNWENAPQYAHVAFAVIEDESSESTYFEQAYKRVLFYLIGT